MELKDFISKSIKDICYGINEAREETKNSKNMRPIAAIMGKAEKQLIEFDIAVTLSENSQKSGSVKTKAGFGIKVIEAKLNGDVDISKKMANETISRIKFSVPFYPQYLSDDCEIKYARASDFCLNND